MGFLPQYFYQYERLARNEYEHDEDARPRERRKSLLTAFVLIGLAIAVLIWMAFGRSAPLGSENCDSIDDGFQCSPEISHYWGQYSAYHRVPSTIPDTVPSGCNVTLANILSRHGARDPALSKTIVYGAFVAALKANVTSFHGRYAFLNDYNYTLGADMLTEFGRRQMVNSGIKFYQRYRALAGDATPFLRAASQERVVESARLFGSGFHEAFVRDAGRSKDNYPYPLVVITEPPNSNNTLSHGACPAFSSGSGNDAQWKWIDVFAPRIVERLTTDMPGLQLVPADVITFMDLCPFETMASPTGALSHFCDIFTQEEWRQYDYYESLGKWYGYGNGNYFGATNGVGFVNELIARLTHSPVEDHTSTNSTLDDDPVTFPVDKKHTLFADFSHDNDIAGIIAALGIYNATQPLSNTTLQPAHETKGYSASWTVPFGARVYFEKLQCGHDEADEHVRIIVNDRIVPLPWCGGAEDGLCSLEKFVHGLSFARSGGRWDECFN